MLKKLILSTVILIWSGWAQAACPTISVTSKTNVSCFGGNNGSISVSVSGTSAYSLEWSTGATTATISSLSQGTYFCTVTDNATGCTDFEAVNITEPNQLILTGTSTPVDCKNQATGSIDLNVYGGKSPYTYAWSNGAGTAQDPSNLQDGSYTVTVTDANSCTVTRTFTVSEPAQALQYNSTRDSVSCNAGSNGSIDLTVWGGTAAYTYAWSTGALSQDVSGLSAGTYTVTVTDNKGCTISPSITVYEPAAIAVSESSSNNTCYNSDNGTIGLNVSGGVGPYTYQWHNSQTTMIANNSLNNLSADVYSYTVTDSRNCKSSSGITITEPTEILVQETHTPVSCYNGSNGAVDLTVTGGTTGYTYSWTKNGGGFSASTQDITGLVQGTYTVTVTDAQNCTKNRTVTISQPQDSVQNTITVDNVLCYGDATGDIITSVSGGTAPYGYLWSTGATTSSINNMIAGSYAVTVTDSRGCMSSYNRNITQPVGPITVVSQLTDVSCNALSDGAIDINVSGGTFPYNYTWQSTQYTLSPVQDLLNVEADDYTVTITDANGCKDTNLYTITEPSALQMSESVTDVLCFGNSTGVIDVTVTGGTPAYNYAWENSNGAMATTLQDLINLPADNYSLTVTDNNGCTISDDFDVNEPASPVSATQVLTAVDCYGNNSGSIDLTPAGGSYTYTYLWSNGNTNQDLSNLTAGTYNVTITDGNGCSANYSNIITQPAASLVGSYTKTDVDCYGNLSGAIDLSVTGGTTPYAYSWTSANYQLTNNQDQSNIGADAYQVIITDANACKDTVQATITQPSAIQLAAQPTAVSCYGLQNGAVDVSLSGGTPTYTYVWEKDGAAFSSSTEDLSNVYSGSYELFVTDLNGCEDSVSVNVTQPNAPLTTTLSGVNIACYGTNTGSVSQTPTGGTTPYTYAWNTGATTKDASNLYVGAYTVTITDANGCDTVYNTTLSQPAAPLTSTYTVQDVDCHGNNTGSIDITPAGGTAPYSYQWTNNTYTLVNTQDQNQLYAGNYAVTITDTLGCSFSQSMVVAEPAAFTITRLIDDVNCYGGNDGSVDVTLTGGVTPYTYSWTNSQNATVATTEDATQLTADTYTFLATDDNGCTITRNYVVSQPNAPLTATSTISDVLCYGDASGIVDLHPVGGTQPYTYSWTNSATTQDLNGVVTGTYTATILDAQGCDTNYTYFVDQPTAPILVTNTITNVDCYGNSTGEVDITATGGTTPYSYSWISSNFTLNGVEDMTSVQADTFMLTLTDSNACTWVDTFVVTQPAQLVSNEVVTDVLCHGDSTGAINFMIQGGVTPYSYQWNSGQVTEDLVTIPAGSYVITVTDDHNCTLTDSFVVAEPASLPNGDTIVYHVSCYGGNDGTIEFYPYGGTAPYYYNWSSGHTVPVFTDITSGDYFLTMTDANGCIFMDTVYVDQPDSLAFVVDIDSVVCHGESNGSIMVNVSGGVLPYDFRWSDSTFVLNKTTSTISGYPTGDYTVTVTDEHGCVKTESYFIPQPDAWSVEMIVTDILCPGESSGAINVTVSGNTEPYSYLWSNDETTEDITGLAAGNYILTITDVLACDTVVSAYVSQPDSMEISALITDVSCRDAGNGEIEVEVTGGTGSFSFSWSDGQYENPAVELFPGEYSVTATDANGCSVSDSYIIQPSAEACINLTNTITPNGDGVNDTWFIENIELYPNMQMIIYNQVGLQVFEKSGEYIPWDGTFKGNELPIGTYFYVLNLNNGGETYSGTITILR